MRCGWRSDNFNLAKTNGRGANPGRFCFVNLRCGLAALTQPFRLTAQLQPGQVRLTFPALVGETYRVEFTDTLASPTWFLLEEIVGASTNVIVVFDPGAPMPRRGSIAFVGFVNCDEKVAFLLVHKTCEGWLFA